METAKRLLQDLGAEPDLNGLHDFRGDGPADTASSLTKREREMLARMAVGVTNRRIAADLGPKPKTVNRHVGSIFDKLGVTSRPAAVATALRSGAI